MIITDGLIKRFWKKTEIIGGSECIYWMGALNRVNGYGVIRIGPKQGLIYAHRLSYILSNGPIPPEKTIMHSCDNPQCVNSQHLKQGTPKENTHDSLYKGRMRNQVGRIRPRVKRSHK